MANYFSITIDSAYPAAPAIQVSDSDSGSWVTHNLQVKVSLEKPSALSATHYKLWGINEAASEGAASWVVWPGGSSITVTGTLANVATEQIVSAKFKDDGVDESNVVTASGVYFSWTEPSKHHSAQWKQAFSIVDYDAASSATLVNTVDNIEVEFNKTNIPGLSFDSLDISGLIISGNTITVTSGSAVYELINGSDTNKVSVTKVFENTAVPMVMVNTGSGFTTITAYDGNVRSTVSGTHGSRLENVSYTSGTKTLEFDVKEFSTYGFTTVNKVEFTELTNGGYNGNAVTIEVSVLDTNNEGVESAPVTISLASGDAVGSFTANPVNTDAYGIATFTLNLDTLGTAMFSASVDAVQTSDDLKAWCITEPTSLQRSLLTQYEQIRFSADYDDAIADVNTVDVAEPDTATTSGNIDDVLQHDMNVFRTLLKQIKGTTDWFSELDKYFDPTTTDSGSTATKDLTLSNIAGHTLDSKTIILAVTEDASGAGYDISEDDIEIRWTTTLPYAKHTNRRGLPIFYSGYQPGTYFDEGGSDDVCRIDLLDTSTGSEFTDTLGNEIYAKFHDGADVEGGEYTNVLVRFYTVSGTYTWTATDPTNVSFVFPMRKVLDELQEYEWLRTDFVSSWEGDATLVDDVVNLWSYTGASNDLVGPSFTNTSDYYILSSGIDNLRDAVDEFNDEIGDRIYTESNYVISGQAITDSLNALDQQLKDINDLVTESNYAKYVELLSSDLDAETIHALPYGIVYTPYSTAGQEGKNMEVYVNGQLFSASTGINGINGDRDYAETTASGITFHVDLLEGNSITYLVKN